MTLREVLHAHIPTLSPESTVHDAIDKMDVYQFPALVVVDEDRKPVAVLTEGDLCRAVVDQASLLSLRTEPALRFATRDPIVAAPDQELSEALHEMLSRGLTLLPIVEDDILCGVVLRVDLMQAMLVGSAVVGPI